MAKVKLDTMLGGVNSRLGNVVYSEWKGIKYIRRWVKAKDANSEAQSEVRSNFSRIINVWKALPAPVKLSWDFHVRGKALTGYNLFFKSNFGLLKSGKLLELSRGNGLSAPEELSASISDSGVISVSFRKMDESSMVSIFIQNRTEQCYSKLITARIDVDTSVMPVQLEGFDPRGDYNVYAVASSSAMDGAEAVSDSTGCSVTR